MFVRGEVSTLEIGSGGGPFSVELLARRNKVRVIEIDDATAKKTLGKADLYFPDSSFEIIIGHVNKLDLGGPYHQVVMTEVLEHIKDDRECLKRIYVSLEPGGRLVISTPTAIGGLLKNDHVSPTENGHHVRVGYEGPELDKYLHDLGFVVIYRTHYGFAWARFVQEIQRLCYKMPWRPLVILFSAGCVIIYRLTSFLDRVFTGNPAGQITVAIKC
jgi:SAM-dependent methyltransferase